MALSLQNAKLAQSNDELEQKRTECCTDLGAEVVESEAGKFYCELNGTRKAEINLVCAEGEQVQLVEFTEGEDDELLMLPN